MAPIADKKVKTVKGLPAVPESVLKHRKRREASRKKRLQSAITKKAEHIKKRKEIFKRAEQYVKEYRLKERDEIRLIRQAKTRGNFYVPGEARLAFVIRIRGLQARNCNNIYCKVFYSRQFVAVARSFRNCTNIKT